MRLQVLSDLHLDTEVFDPQPAPGAELLVLAGDLHPDWSALERFAGWPVPVVVVAGNHEFDDRELDDAWPALRRRCDALGLRLLERETVVLTGADGRRIRFVGTVRWCDFDLFGEARRAKAMRAGEYFARVQRSRLHGRTFDAEAVRGEALACRAWLARALAEPTEADATVAVTHFAPSLRSADPRYGAQHGTASFCNADDDLMPGVDLWLHGHVHCRHDYTVAHADGRRTRVVCQARGLADKGEVEGYEPFKRVEV
ncbi:metallophosphoesterase [Aquabacterium sp. J223]|uniref:metallophosphoesterase n=1 Tax=Aquabacterium sp. J223 TaxID=2898431 RepID=UPI0021AE14BA|nr:metallophosphoesterase [Aquabacterium sp. J223]UUX96108.1 metallophosphoesterase [Aquabacterium sp. J223]